VHWFGVRCVLHDAEEQTFEERITVWQAADFTEAVAFAEDEAEVYAEQTGVSFVGFAQAYVLPGAPTHGGEVFALLRQSELDVDAYLDRFFDTGDELEASLDE
jgi:hypothetical protein